MRKLRASSSFNAITDALQAMEQRNLWAVKQILMKAQQDAEEIYISWEDKNGG